MSVFYAAIGLQAQGLELPLDWTSIVSFQMTGLLTSRSSLTLATTDPSANPIIDPNYHATETDWHVFREGIPAPRRLSVDTLEGQQIMVEEQTHQDSLFPVECY